MLKKKHASQIAQIICATNIFEWYEFTVSGYLAFVLGRLFFPHTSNGIAIIESFATFALSYAVRPIGALIWGYLADRYSIKIVLKNTILLMTIPTVLIGLLPTYTQIGIVATVALISIRIIQGFAAGGELPASMTYLHEWSISSKYKNFICSLVNFGGMFGVLLSSFIIFLLYLNFSESAILEWAWRLPFLIGLPLSIIIIYFRRGIVTPDPQPVKLNDTKITTKFWISVVKIFILIAFLQVNVYIEMVWMPTYLVHFLNIPQIYARVTNTISLVMLIILILLFGFLGSKFNYKKMLLGSVILLTFVSYPLFALLNHANFAILLTIQLIFAVLIAIIEGTFILIICNLFKSKNKNLGMAIGFVIPSAIFGGSAPLICSYFIYSLKFVNFPGLYILILGLFALPVALSLL